MLEVLAREDLPKENGTPPDSHTGAQTSERKSPYPISVGIDWLSWTCKDHVKPDSICDLVGIPVQDWVLGSGALNYRDGLRSGPYTVLYNGTQEGMGVHLRCSGDACRDWQARQEFDWSDMLRYLVSRGSFSRVDVAFDVRDGAFPLDRFILDCQEGNLTTRWKEWEVKRTQAFDGPTLVSTGTLIRFGGRSSRSYLRAYDKGLQLGEDAGQWTRVELETKGERTAPLLDKVLSQGLSSVAGVVNGLLTMREPSILERWKRPIAAYWLDFIGSAERCKLVVEKKPFRDAGDIAAWVDRQVGPSLAMLLRHYNYGPEYIQRLADLAGSRMKHRHHEMIKEVN